jgi:hypothetical protein
MAKCKQEKYGFDDYKEVYYEDEKGEEIQSIYIKSEDEAYDDYTDSEKIANKIDSDMIENNIRDPEAESKINKLAKRWSDLNQELKAGDWNASKEKDIQDLSIEIITKVFSLYENSYKRTNGNHRGKYETDMITINRHGVKIAVEKFYNFLCKTVSTKSSSGYDANQNDNYLAYFRTILNMRSKDSKQEIERKRKKEEKVQIVPLYAHNKEGEEVLLTDIMQISDGGEQYTEEGYIKLLVPVMRLCEINLRNSNLTDNKKKKRWLFYRMHYTFDIVKGIEEIKTCYIPPSELIRTEENPHENMTSQELEVYCRDNEEFSVFKKKNYEIYRNMRLALVEIMKEGNAEDFTDMLDIIRRCLREGVNLNKRQEYLAQGLAKDDEFAGDDVSRSTIHDYVNYYKDDVLKALKSDQLTD